jgi:ABC-type sugar transport system permease subunit
MARDIRKPIEDKTPPTEQSDASMNLAKQDFSQVKTPTQTPALYKRRIRWGDMVAPYLFISPFVIFFIIFFAGPTIYSFGLSFFRYKGYGEAKFVGFDNYNTILNYHIFWSELGNTSFYWLAHVIPLMVGAFLLAVLVRSKLVKGKSFFKPVIFLPNIIAVFATALIFQNLFGTRYGVINTLFGTDIPWLTNDDITRWVVVLLITWRSLGWWFVVYLAGLSSINPEVEEAAIVDGATSLQRLVYIIVPLMRSVFLLAFVVDAAGSFRIFTEPNILTGRGFASMAGEGTAPVLNLMLSNLNGGVFGQAAAIGWLLFIIVAVVALVQFRLFRDTSEEVND